MKRFSYDDMAPIYALSGAEKEIAIELNTKGALDGLTEEEHSKLKSLYELGIEVLEKK